MEVTRTKRKETNESYPGRKVEYLEVIHKRAAKKQREREQVIFGTVHTTSSGKVTFVKRKPLSVFPLGVVLDSQMKFCHFLHISSLAPFPFRRKPHGFRPLTSWEGYPHFWLQNNLIALMPIKVEETPPVSNAIFVPSAHRLFWCSFKYFDQPRLLSLERSHRLGGGVGRALGALGGTSAEAVAELAGDELECAHAAGTGGLSSLGLLTPVVLSDASARVAAVGASVLLDVERARAAASAQNVRLVVALAERSSTLGHFEVSTVRLAV